MSANLTFDFIKNIVEREKQFESLNNMIKEKKLTWAQFFEDQLLKYSKTDYGDDILIKDDLYLNQSYIQDEIDQRVDSCTQYCTKDSKLRFDKICKLANNSIPEVILQMGELIKHVKQLIKKTSGENLVELVCDFIQDYQDHNYYLLQIKYCRSEMP